MDEMDDFESKVFPEFECVNVLQVGEGFGELALISNDKRTATILVREDCDLAIINRDTFQKILKAYHEKLKEEKVQDLMKF